MKPRVYLVWVWVLMAAGVALVFETTQLPFAAGSPATDLLAPLSALGCGVAAVVLTWKAFRGASDGHRCKAFALLSLFMGLLVAAAAALLLAFIFLICGTYWARDTC